MTKKPFTNRSHLATFEFEIFVVSFRNQATSPFFEWFYSVIDVNHRARILIRLERLRLGNFGDFKSVGGGVLEIRFHFPPGYRIYFLKEANKAIILLGGGSKASQSNDIRLAKKLASQVDDDERNITILKFKDSK